MTYDGYASIIQPQIRPLFDSKSAIQVLAPVVFKEDRSSYDTVKNVWKNSIVKEANFERKWEKILHEGIYANSLLSSQKVRTKNKVTTAVLRKEQSLESNKFEVIFAPSSSVYDGRYANNGWLQEIPKPITSLTWDNAAFVSMKVAKKLNIKNGQMIEISIAGVSIKVPAWIVPGQNQKTITLELGYGREFSGRIGSGVGFNVYPLRTSSNMGYAMNAEIKTLKETYPLASTQEHYGLEEDKLAAPGFSDLSTNEVQSRIPELSKAINIRRV
jgi:molybdopterin-containing oxidoreductase family iron-sulfur binding subunit